MNRRRLPARSPWASGSRWRASGSTRTSGGADRTTTTDTHPANGSNIQRDDRPHPCASGNHQLGWSCYGYGTDAPGAVVMWQCIRNGCGAGLKYGLYADGPGGPVMPRPTPEQEAEWTAWSAAKRVEDDRKRAEWIAQEVDGECNARWDGGRCARAPGHEGPHGQEIAPGMVVAPFEAAP